MNFDISLIIRPSRFKKTERKKSFQVHKLLSSIAGITQHVYGVYYQKQFWFCNVLEATSLSWRVLSGVLCPLIWWKKSNVHTRSNPEKIDILKGAGDSSCRKVSFSWSTFASINIRLMKMYKPNEKTTNSFQVRQT